MQRSIAGAATFFFVTSRLEMCGRPVTNLRRRTGFLRGAFYEDHAEFFRRDRSLTTKLEVVVSSGR